MKKLPIVAGGSLEAVMDEMSNEVAKVMAKMPNKEDSIAFSTFFGTLTKIMLDITEEMGLSSEEQENIQTACGTWFDLGMLVGRSPQLLVDILKRANAKIETFTPPEWFLEKDRAIAEAGEIVRQHDTESQN